MVVLVDPCQQLPSPKNPLPHNQKRHCQVTAPAQLAPPATSKLHRGPRGLSPPTPLTPHPRVWNSPGPSVSTFLLSHSLACSRPVFVSPRGPAALDCNAGPRKSTQANMNPAWLLWCGTFSTSWLLAPTRHGMRVMEKPGRMWREHGGFPPTPRSQHERRSGWAWENRQVGKSVCEFGDGVPNQGSG
jgi:hypothetical protein